MSRHHIRRGAAVGLAVLALAAGTAPLAFGAGPDAPAGPRPAAPSPVAPVPTATLSAQDAADLQFTREEERMAHDLYTAFAELYPDAAVFGTIAQAEQRHFTTVGNLLTTHQLTDPSAGKPVGSYADATLQSLYDQWLAQGRVSVDQAYAAGVALEQRDIADLQRLIDTTSVPTLDTVYSHLLAASQMHLAAFQAAQQGVPIGPRQSMVGVGTPGAGMQRMTGQGVGAGQGVRAGQGAGNGQMLRDGSCLGS